MDDPLVLDCGGSPPLSGGTLATRFFLAALIPPPSPASRRQQSGGTGKINRGVLVSASNLAGGSGPVSITGQSSLFGGAAGQYNQGIYLASATMTSSGAISLTGTGGTGTGYNNGMQLQSANVTAGGLLTIAGSGGGAATGTMNIGVQLTNPCTLMGGGGSSIDGTGGGGTLKNHGVFMNTGVVTSLALTDITGTAGAGTGSLDEAGTYF